MQALITHPRASGLLRACCPRLAFSVCFAIALLAPMSAFACRVQKSFPRDAADIGVRPDDVVVTAKPVRIFSAGNKGISNFGGDHFDFIDEIEIVAVISGGDSPGLEPKKIAYATSFVPPCGQFAPWWVQKAKTIYGLEEQTLFDLILRKGDQVWDIVGGKPTHQ